jgi:hypothetical protein
VTRISEKKAIEMGLIPKLSELIDEQAKSKYHSRKVTIDNIVFDSQKEANYYLELKLRKRANDIVDFELQPVYILQDAYYRDAKKVQPITYKADFKIVHKNFDVEIVDVKGMKTEVYRIKKKLLLAKYPSIRFTEV